MVLRARIRDLLGQGIVGFIAGLLGSRLVRRPGMRTLLITATAATGFGFLILANLPTGGHKSPLPGAVVLVGFGTVGARARLVISTVSGDRIAILVAAGAGFAGTLAACFGPRHIGRASIAASITTIDVPAHSDTSEESIQVRRTA